MSFSYFKRYRMEVDLRRPWLPPRLPEGYRFIAWSPDRLDDHATAKRDAFRGEIDATVFDCLGDPSGCRRLMQEIASKPGFLPEATWLIEYATGGTSEPCGTIQGLRVTPRYGGVQNVGVTPWHRGRGLGSALVQAACFGFAAMGMQRAFLEVTANNVPAIRLYESLGFRRTKTHYKAVESPASLPLAGSPGRR
ncbi:GNAT family N-acetyltransferase [Botrimarina hoheduenensis]|uniref:Putative acetyltransferase n=1 Tax=Botrimarina hoheduenensis TaxID=2528000 RepID=A0A5C5WEC7_9BACT|nr:GNAT family N-acetyltransferase [Botrimarina hoheduenensis]TWT48405.1 putative acetyltransferase [Botrimarina hoheduenensis]